MTHPYALAARAAHVTRLARLGGFLLLLAWLLPGAVRAQAPAWAGAAPGSLTQANGTSIMRGVATDASGNVFVTGQFTGSVAFGGTLLTSRGGNDLFVAKYVPATATWAWAQSGGGTGSDIGYGVAVSGSSVYVTGLLTNTTANASGVLFGGTGTTPGTVQVNGASGTASQDLVLAKYTDNGPSATLGWTQVGGGTSGDIGQGVAVSGGSVYVMGYIQNNTANANGVLFGGTGTTAGTVQVNGASGTPSFDLVLAKYTDNGTSATLGWTQVGGGIGTDVGYGVAVSGSSVYVTGYIQNTTGNGNGVLFGGTGTTPGTVQVNGASSSNSTDLVLAKYTDNGTSAALGWTQVGGGTGGDLGYGVAVSGSSVYVTGQLINNTANANGVLFGGTGTTAGTVQVNGASGTPSGDLVLAKYTDNGTTAALGWTQVGGGASGDLGYGVAVSGSSVYVTGSLTNSTGNAKGVLFGGTGTTPGTVQVNGASGTVSIDLVLAKYTDNGTTAALGWTQVGGGATGTDTDLGYGVAVSGSSVVAGGYVIASASYAFGPVGTGALAGTTGQRVVLALADAGTGTWQALAPAFNGGTSQTQAVAADASGNVFITGSFTGQVDIGSTRLSSVGNNDLFVAKYVPSTGTWAWAQSGGGTDNDIGYGIAVNGSSVYVTGQLTNNTANSQGVLFGGTGTTPGTVQVNGVSGTSNFDLVLAKYTDNGSSATLGWTQVGGGANADIGYGVAVSGSSVYVTGQLVNSTTNANGVLFGGTGTTAGTVPVNGASAISGADLVLAKYTDNGPSAALGWTQVGGGTGGDVGLGVAVSGGSVYMTGYITNNTANASAVLFGGTSTTPGTVQVNGASATNGADLVLAKYTDNGPSAALGWTQVGGGTGQDVGFGVAVSSGSVYVTGYITNTTGNSQGVLFGGTSTTPGTVQVNGATATSSFDLVLARYTDNGPSAALSWTQVGGGTGNDVGQGVAVSGSSVYVTGYITNSTSNANAVLFGGTGTTPGTVQVNGASATSSFDLVLARYTDNGPSAALSWTQVGGGTGTDIGYGVAVSGQNVLAAGSVTPSASFGTFTIASPAGATTSVLARLVDATLAPLPPAITSFTPLSGPVGTSVTITGTNLGGATSVRFNGTAQSSFTSNSATQLVLTVPTGATTGSLTVTTAGGTSAASSQTFTVCAAPMAVARNTSVTLDVNGNATVAATAVNNGSTANCGSAGASALSVSPSSLSCTDAVPATVASALSFDGNGQYLTVAPGNSLPIGNSSYTLEAWIKPTAMGAYGIIGWGNYGTGPKVNALRLFNDFRGIGLVNYWWGPDLVTTTADLSGSWHHVAATYDAGANVRTLYLDGAAISSDNPGPHAVPNADNLTIGNTNGNEYFNGSIDEVRVWSVARTQAQLSTTKGLGLPGSSAGLVAYYRLNEGSGLTAADATGNAANRATLVNGPTWTTDAAPVVNGVPVTLTVTDAGGNIATASAVVTVSVPATSTTTWNGSLNTSPVACQNWSFGKVPDAATNVVVPASLVLYPNLSTGTLAAKDVTINSGGSFTANAGTTLQVSGNLANNGTATFSGPVQFVGSAATQTLSHGGGFTTMVVNKPAGTVQLAQNLTINSALTLTSGTLTTTGSYQVTLGGSTSLSESDASYVLGKVVVNRTLAAGTAEPFAGLGLTLTPAVGSVAPGTTLVTRTTGTALAGAGTSQSILRSFNIVPTVNTGLNVQMDFAYFTHELNGIPTANLALFKSVSGGTPWIPQRGTTAIGSVITKTGITDFSVWTLGNSAAPLPVELAAFTATAEGPAAVRLAWATASEKNSASFDVERSPNGVQFDRLGTVAAAGSSSAARSYALLDAKLPAGTALLYYRLKQVDLDGTFSYSPVRTVGLKGAAAGLALFPNPVHGGAATLTGALPGTMVTVFDALGRVVLAAPADAAGTTALVLPVGLPAGVYVVRAGSRALRLTVE